MAIGELSETLTPQQSLYKQAEAIHCLTGLATTLNKENSVLKQFPLETKRKPQHKTGHKAQKISSMLGDRESPLKPEQPIAVLGLFETFPCWTGFPFLCPFLTW